MTIDFVYVIFCIYLLSLLVVTWIFVNNWNWPFRW